MCHRSTIIWCSIFLNKPPWNPLRRSTDRTIGAGQNDDEEEQRLVPPWMIIFRPPSTVQAMTAPDFYGSKQQQWRARRALSDRPTHVPVNLPCLARLQRQTTEQIWPLDEET
ncbi:hypothetical protein ACLOJK_022791 [Asimina triloba]